MSFSGERQIHPPCFNCVFRSQETPPPTDKQLSSSQTNRVYGYCEKRNIILTLHNLPANCGSARSAN